VSKSFKPETICMLVSSCWQSGLDYSEFALDFVNLFLNTDYQTALECFTVIEESAVNMTSIKKNKIIKLLENKKEGHSTEKSVLLDKLIMVLR